MAENAIKIQKILEAGKVIYPATILDAVKDATAKIQKGDAQVDNPNFKKTLREILAAYDTKMGELSGLTTEEKSNLVAAINELKTAIGTLNSNIEDLDTTEDVQAVTLTEATDAAGAKLVFNGVKEENGIIAAGSLTSELQFAKVATSGDAKDVAIAAPEDGFKSIGNVSNVQDAIEYVDAGIDSLATVAKNTAAKMGVAIAETDDLLVDFPEDSKFAVEAAKSGSVIAGADNLADAIADVAAAVDTITGDEGILATIKGDATTNGDTLGKIEDRVEDIETALNVAGADQATIDKVDEVLTWFAGVNESDPVGADVITAVAAVGKAANGEEPATGLIKKVADLEATGANKVESSETNGNIKIDGVETNVYTEVPNTVHDADYKHITVTANSVSDGVNTFEAFTHPEATEVAAAAVKVGSDAMGHVVLGDALVADDITISAHKYSSKYAEDEDNTVELDLPEGGIETQFHAFADGVADTMQQLANQLITITDGEDLVKDSNYAHITVTENSVSDGTTTMTLPELSVKDGSANFVAVDNHEVEIKTDDVAEDATGLATAAGVYAFALTASDAADTADYADVF